MNSITALLPVCVILTATAVSAQEAPSPGSPQKEHQWLHQLVGHWETTSEAVMGSGKPPVKGTGTIHSKSLGGFWVISEMETSIQGTSIRAVQTLGYDAKRKKYIGTWVDSMINYLWTYEGSVNETGRILTLEATGPDFTGGGKPVLFRDTYEFKSKDLIALTSAMQTQDGKWVTFMTGTARRVPAPQPAGD